MERALWKNREYYASDVVEKFEIEEAIRKASNKELFCTDPDCENPLLRYCHGEKKRAYFAHITNSNCDYADFERKTQFIQKIRYKLFDLFRSKGYDIRMESKLLPKHYAPLEIKINDKSIVLEIGTKTTTVNQISYLREEYEKKNIKLKWIVVSGIRPLIKEKEVFFLKRYELNKSFTNDLIVVNEGCTQAAQYKLDRDVYMYHDVPINLGRFQQIYSEISDLEQLCFENEQLTLFGFNQRYKEWLSAKKQYFIEEVKKYDYELTRNATAANVSDGMMRGEDENGKQISRATNEFFQQEKEEQSRLARQREEFSRAAIDRFTKLLPAKQAEVLNYTKKVSHWSDFTSLKITDKTPLDEQFEKIFGMLPHSIKEKVIEKMNGKSYKYW